MQRVESDALANPHPLPSLSFLRSVSRVVRPCLRIARATSETRHQTFDFFVDTRLDRTLSPSDSHTLHHDAVSLETTLAKTVTNLHSRKPHVPARNGLHDRHRLVRCAKRNGLSVSACPIESLPIDAWDDTADVCGRRDDCRHPMLCVVVLVGRPALAIRRGTPWRRRIRVCGRGATGRATSRGGVQPLLGPGETPTRPPRGLREMSGGRLHGKSAR